MRIHEFYAHNILKIIINDFFIVNLNDHREMLIKKIKKIIENRKSLMKLIDYKLPYNYSLDFLKFFFFFVKENEGKILRCN